MIVYFPIISKIFTQENFSQNVIPTIKNVINIIVDPTIFNLSTNKEAIMSPVIPPAPTSKLFIECILNKEHVEIMKKTYPKYLSNTDSSSCSLALLYIITAIYISNNGIKNAALPNKKYKVSLTCEPNNPPKFSTSAEEEFIQLLSFSL